MLEPHGEYNPSKEYTLSARSKVSGLHFHQQDDLKLVEVELTNGNHYLLAINTNKVIENKIEKNFSYQQANYTFTGRFNLFQLNAKQ